MRKYYRAAGALLVVGVLGFHLPSRARGAFRFLGDSRVKAVLETLHSPTFGKAVQELEGYDISPMGTTALEG